MKYIKKDIDINLDNLTDEEISEVISNLSKQYKSNQSVDYVSYNSDENKLIIATFEYDELVDNLIRERYSISQEFAILRQRDTKQDEFATYNEYAEQCKARARELLSENENQ